MTISTEQLKQILAGCEGVAPEPWTLDQRRAIFPRDATDWVIGNDKDTATQTGKHLFNCRPIVVRSLVIELLERRSQGEASHTLPSDRAQAQGDGTERGYVKALRTYRRLKAIDHEFTDEYLVMALLQDAGLDHPSSYKDGVEALHYAQMLAAVLHSKHYAKSAPDWKPRPDLLGLLTQIDNMTAALVLPPFRDTDPIVRDYPSKEAGRE